MDSKELQNHIAGILWCMDTSDEDCGIKALKEIMSLLSENCWLKDNETLNLPSLEIRRPVKPIEVDK
jgi:hypothetical protein